ncbi:MAG: hypothetical protein K2M85_06785 [Paramuribaculum sp.]|nr:hypothetical protein [Paramuribaculum sp.]
MDIPVSLYGSLAQEGEIYFFTKDCPKGIGIPDHPHILIRNNGSYLFLNTCSSQITTSIRLATLRGWDSRTYPVIKRDSFNNLMKDSYVDCNQFVELSPERFGELMSEGKIKRDVGNGVIPEAQLAVIRQGIKLSVNISDEDKERLLK